MESIEVIDTLEASVKQLLEIVDLIIGTDADGLTDRIHNQNNAIYSLGVVSGTLRRLIDGLKQTAG